MFRKLGAAVGVFFLTPTAMAQPSNPASNEINETIGEMSAGGLTVKTLRIDLNTPVAPAGAILGDDDIAFTNVRTGSELSAQLLSGFDADGVLQPGVAISGSPYLWSNPRETRQEYIDSAGSFAGFFKRTQISVATKQLPDNGVNSIGVGVSASWQLLKEQDLRFADDGYACLRKELRKIAPIVAADSRAAAAKAIVLLGETHASIAAMNAEDGEQGAMPLSEAVSKFPFTRPAAELREDYGDTMSNNEILTELDLKVEFDTLRSSEMTRIDTNRNTPLTLDRAKCDTKFENYVKGRDSLVLTLAKGYVSTTGKYGDLKSDKSALYLQYRTGMCTDQASKNKKEGIPLCSGADFGARVSSYLGVPMIGLLSYVTDDTVRVSDTIEEKADRFVVGIGTAAEQEGQALDFQISFTRSDFATARPDAEEFKASIAYSYKVAKGVWIEFKAGTKSSDDVSDDSFAGVSFKFSPDMLGS